MFCKPKILLNSWTVWMMLMLRRWRDVAKWYSALPAGAYLRIPNARSINTSHVERWAGQSSHTQCENPPFLHKHSSVSCCGDHAIAHGSGNIVSFQAKSSENATSNLHEMREYVWCKSFKCRLWRKAMHIWQIYLILWLLLGIRSRCLFVFDALTFNDLSPLSTLLTIT